MQPHKGSTCTLSKRPVVKVYNVPNKRGVFVFFYHNINCRWQKVWFLFALKNLIRCWIFYKISWNHCEIPCLSSFVIAITKYVYIVNKIYPKAIISSHQRQFDRMFLIARHFVFTIFLYIALSIVTFVFIFVRCLLDH